MVTADSISERSKINCIFFANDVTIADKKSFLTFYRKKNPPN